MEMVILNSVKFFLGANTPDGFYSLFDELYNPYTDWQMYVIKGGPGSGKSTLMKAVADEAEKRNLFVERIPCSSDPMSLDGVIIPDIKVAIADGTSPHVVEPVFPGVCEHIVDLSKCWDTEKLKKDTAKIKMISMTNSAAHKKCVKYMKAAKLLDSETDKYTEKALIDEKAERFVSRIFNSEITPTENFTTKNRFISALSPLGITVMNETISEYCDNIICIKDSYDVSPIIVEKIVNEAVNRKINMIVCRCPMDPLHKIEHVIFPDLRLGVFTSNTYHTIKGTRTVSSSRFIDKNIINKHKNSIGFIKKAKEEMINEAVNSLKAAKSAHDILESYYIDAMDFDKVNKIKDEVINSIFK